jgi:hypothetical protein
MLESIHLNSDSMETFTTILHFRIERYCTHTNDSESNHGIISFAMRMHMTSVHPIRGYISIPDLCIIGSKQLMRLTTRRS